MFDFFWFGGVVAEEEGDTAAVGRPPPSSPARLAVRMMAEVMKKLQSNLSVEEKRESKNKRMNSLSEFLFLFVVGGGRMGATWHLMPAPRVWLTYESTRGSFMDPPTIWWYTLVRTIGSLDKVKVPHHTAQISPCLVNVCPSHLGLSCFRSGPTLVGPKDLFSIQTRCSISSNAQSWAFLLLGPFSFIFLFIQLTFFYLCTYKTHSLNFHGYQTKIKQYFILFTLFKNYIIIYYYYYYYLIVNMQLYCYYYY